PDRFYAELGVVDRNVLQRVLVDLADVDFLLPVGRGRRTHQHAKAFDIGIAPIGAPLQDGVVTAAAGNHRTATTSSGACAAAPRVSRPAASRSTVGRRFRCRGPGVGATPRSAARAGSPSDDRRLRRKRQTGGNRSVHLGNAGGVRYRHILEEIGSTMLVLVILVRGGDPDRGETFQLEGCVVAAAAEGSCMNTVSTLNDGMYRWPISRK